MHKWVVVEEGLTRRGRPVAEGHEYGRLGRAHKQPTVAQHAHSGRLVASRQEHGQLVVAEVGQAQLAHEKPAEEWWPGWPTARQGLKYESERPPAVEVWWMDRPVARHKIGWQEPLQLQRLPRQREIGPEPLGF